MPHWLSCSYSINTNPLCVSRNGLSSTATKKNAPVAKVDYEGVGRKKLMTAVL